MSFLTFFYVEFKEVRGVKTARRQIGICCKIQDKYLLKETIKKCLQILLKINAVSEWSRTWHLYTYFGPGSRKQVTCTILHCDVVKASDGGGGKLPHLLSLSRSVCCCLLFYVWLLRNFIIIVFELLNR